MESAEARFSKRKDEYLKRNGELEAELYDLYRYYRQFDPESPINAVDRNHLVVLIGRYEDDLDSLVDESNREEYEPYRINTIHTYQELEHLIAGWIDLIADLYVRLRPGSFMIREPRYSTSAFRLPTSQPKLRLETLSPEVRQRLAEAMRL